LTRDVPTLHRYLSGLTTHRFNLHDELDYGAFLHLVQHHGYPTPLLDWTYSPFIAAYFAFRDHRKARGLDSVRILVFDAQEWSRRFERARILNPAFRHVSILEPLATNNPRMLPQQAISAFTNCDDIEGHIAGAEVRSGATFLRAIDLPASECRKVLAELNLMGINAGSLFPGLDGACQQLRDRFFD
jgi:hypothetical protein